MPRGRVDVKATNKKKQNVIALDLRWKPPKTMTILGPLQPTSFPGTPEHNIRSSQVDGSLDGHQHERAEHRKSLHDIGPNDRFEATLKKVKIH